MEKIKFAVIGCGNRGRGVMAEFLNAGSGRASVVKVYDPDPEEIAITRKFWKDQDFKVSGSLEDAVSDPEVNVVAIFSPNAYHCEAILAALKYGKQVFAEKPLATTLEDCEKIRQAEKDSGISIMTGFVLRYAPIYRKAKELLDSGTFGKVINISACENREAHGGGASMSSSRGWRRLRSESGPYLLEKCCHDLDLINWFAGGVPSRVSAFCSLNYFVPENAHLWDKYDHSVYAAAVREKYRINPFTSPKDIFDNHTVIMDYPSGIKANFQLTLATAIPDRRMYIICTEGTIIIECFSDTIKYRRLGENCITTLEFGTDNGHGGGDKVMIPEIIDALLSDKKISTSGSENGMDCARVALAADLSALTGETVYL